MPTPLPFVSHRIGRTRLQHRRSRNGCLTCKRRKVRCNEQKPRCYHCQRLSLECVWKDTTTPPSRREGHVPADEDSSDQSIICSGTESGTAAAMESTWLMAPAQGPLADDVVDLATDHIQDFSLFPDFYLGDFSDAIAPREIALQDAPFTNDLSGVRHSVLARQAASPDVDASTRFHTPRILDPVDNGPICASLRAQLDDMANSSSMVRSAMTAFAAIQSCPDEPRSEEYRKSYDAAMDELSQRFQGCGDKIVMTSSGELGYVLTTIFFLTYINFLTCRLDLANANLAKAHAALQSSSRVALNYLEQRIVAWIRWTDARAAIAGGQGQIVNDTSCILPSTPSSTASVAPSSRITASPGLPPSDSGTYEVMYSLLCQPGIAFFQETQTITGRITRIAHLHRSRGSVEDETEVMAIAAEILRDLSGLYHQRPALMDDAVSGNICHVLTEPLASAVARSFQTYLANFYVCYIHLHRVAHRHLMRSKVVSNAMSKIKEITHLMLRDSNEPIPVNMMWVLFMWGSEEDDEFERKWIVDTIRSCGRSATNANMAAEVLQEIQTRQAKEGTRVDIRSVCVELFDTTFAII